MEYPTLIIAEAGINHNGDSEMALRLVDAAASAKVDVVKFQTYNTKKLVTRNAPKAAYQEKSTDPTEKQFDMLEKLELDYESHRQLKRHAESKGLRFMSTAFDEHSLKFLTDDLGLEILKIPSGEITNGPLLLEYGRTGRHLILSTGMATISEVEQALAVLAFGFTAHRGTPSANSFEKAFHSDVGQQLLKERVVLMHCTSEYPAPLGDINLRAIHTLRNVFGLRVGYSDHSKGILVPSAAAILGAEVIEKHFTLDRTLPGPDHSASLEPSELREMVEIIRSSEQMLGNGEKIPRGAELENRKVARKSLVAASDIQIGERFSTKNLTAKRPGNGRSPMDYWSLIGMRSKKAYRSDELI